MNVESFASAFDALAHTPQEAANLRARADLANALRTHIEHHGWTQSEAAQHCGVTQPRINDLLRGRLSRFSLDALVNLAASCGRQVRVELVDDDSVRARPGPSVAAVRGASTIVRS